MFQLKDDIKQYSDKNSPYVLLEPICLMLLCDVVVSFLKLESLHLHLELNEDELGELH